MPLPRPYGKKIWSGPVSTLNRKLIPAYQAARDFNISYQPLLAICKEHVGFAVVLGKHYHVPIEHMELLVSCA